jgi:hypothetical protein
MNLHFTWWCSLHNQEISSLLINEHTRGCVKTKDGCNNCTHRTWVMLKDGKILHKEKLIWK